LKSKGRGNCCGQGERRRKKVKGKKRQSLKLDPGTAEKVGEVYIRPSGEKKKVKA